MCNDSGPTEAPKGFTSPPMKTKVSREEKEIQLACGDSMFCKVEKEERDKKTNRTIRFEMEGQLDQADLLSCGKHFARSCPDCLGNCPNIKDCKYCNSLSYNILAVLDVSIRGPVSQ